jgi:hypothetical protein
MVGSVNIYNGAFGYSRKGFTSIINQIIEICLFHYNIYKNFDVHIEDERIEKFFNVTKQIKIDETYDVSSLWLKDFFKNAFPDYNAHNIVTKEDIMIRNHIFSNTFFLKDNLITDIKEYDVGIHIRGTDKKNEIVEISLEKIKKTIDSLIKDDPSKKKFFIATVKEYGFIKDKDIHYSKFKYS